MISSKTDVRLVDGPSAAMKNFEDILSKQFPEDVKTSLPALRSLISIVFTGYVTAIATKDTEILMKSIADVMSAMQIVVSTTSANGDIN